MIYPVVFGALENYRVIDKHRAGVKETTIRSMEGNNEECATECNNYNEEGNVCTGFTLSPFEDVCWLNKNEFWNTKEPYDDRVEERKGADVYIRFLNNKVNGKTASASIRFDSEKYFEERRARYPNVAEYASSVDPYYSFYDVMTESKCIYQYSIHPESSTFKGYSYTSNKDCLFYLDEFWTTLTTDVGDDYRNILSLPPTPEQVATATEKHKAKEAEYQTTESILVEQKVIAAQSEEAKAAQAEKERLKEEWWQSTYNKTQ